MVENKLPTTGITIVIVNYNAGELLVNCIESIYSSVPGHPQVIVYDNASADDSLSLVERRFQGIPSLMLIRGTENLGFARANNLAARHARGQYIHFLNPDMIINSALDGDYRKILSEVEQSIFMTRLASAEGILLKNRHLVPRVGNMLRFAFRRPRVFYWNLGASIIIHRKAFDLMGGWPEDYFMYAEDLDFFYTACRLGIPVKYLETALVHIGKGVTHKVWSERERAAIIENSFRKFYRKYRADWEYLLVRPIQLSYLLFNEPASFPLYFGTFLKTLLKKIK